MLTLKSSLQIIVSFGIAAALAYAFGFHLLFAHTALEAIYWGAYYLGTLLVGLFTINKLLRINVTDTKAVLKFN
jgi:hypothetical protein